MFKPCRVTFWLQFPILNVYRTSFDLNNPISGYCDVDIMCIWSTIEPRCSGSDLQEISQVPAVNGSGSPARLGLGAPDSGECGEPETGRRLASRASIPEGERSSVTALTGHARSI